MAPGMTGTSGRGMSSSLRGLQKNHHRHLVGAAWAGTVLIDDDHAAGLCGGGRDRKADEEQETGSSESAKHDGDRVAAKWEFAARRKWRLPLCLRHASTLDSSAGSACGSVLRCKSCFGD